RLLHRVSRASGIDAVHAAGTGQAVVLHDPCHPRHAGRDRAAPGADDVVTRAEGTVSPARSSRSLDVPDLALRVGHWRPGVRAVVQTDMALIKGYTGAMRAYLLAAVLPIALAANAAAQAGRVTGVVKDDHGDPVKSATIIAENPDASPASFTSTSDEKGRFGIIGLRSGVWQMRASAPGYA